MKKWMKVSFVLLFAVLSVAAAVVLPWRYAMRSDNIKTEAEKNPKDTVTAFFDKICSGDFESCESILMNCGSLHLENQLENEVDQLLYDKYLESFSYRLEGEPKITGISAVQKVVFSCMDISGSGAQITENVKAALKERVTTARKNGEVYGEDGTFKPELVEELYKTEVTRMLGEPEKYIRQTELNIQLYFDSGEWKIFADAELAKALTGENLK